MDFRSTSTSLKHFIKAPEVASLTRPVGGLESLRDERTDWELVRELA